MVFGVSTLSLTHLGLKGGLESVDLTALAPSLLAVDFSGIGPSSWSSYGYPVTQHSSLSIVCAPANLMSGNLASLGTLSSLRYLDCSSNQCRRPPPFFLLSLLHSRAEGSLDKPLMTVLCSHRLHAALAAGSVHAGVPGRVNERSDRHALTDSIDGDALTGRPIP